MKILLILLFIPFGVKAQNQFYSLQKENEQLKADLKSWQQANTEHKRLLRKIDTLLNGKDAEEQPLLEDLFEQIKALKSQKDSSKSLQSSIVRAAVLECDKCGKVATELNFANNGSKEAAQIFYDDGWRNIRGLIYCGECKK